MLEKRLIAKQRPLFSEFPSHCRRYSWKFTNRTFQPLNLFSIPVIYGHLAFEVETRTPCQNFVQQTPFDSTHYLRIMTVFIYHLLFGSVLCYGKVVEIWQLIKVFVQYKYTEGLRKTRHTLVMLHVVIVHKMSDRRKRWSQTSTDAACCWLGWGQWVCLCAADSSVTCRQMRSSDWKDLRGLIAYWRTSLQLLSFRYFFFLSERSECKCESFLLIFPWGNKFCLSLTAFSFYYIVYSNLFLHKFNTAEIFRKLNAKFRLQKTVPQSQKPNEAQNVTNYD